MTKTALVSGNKGLLGRHFQAELESRGWQVDGFDLDTADAMNVYRDLDTIYDLIIPAAYQVGGRAAIDGVNTNFAKNLQLDAALFEAAIRTKQRRVLYFSSSAAYPAFMQSKNWIESETSEFFQRSLDECRLKEEWFDDPDNPLEASAADANYGFAKVVGERLAEDARRNGLAVSVCRPFSGYGEDQGLEYPFPSIVRRAKSGDLSVWGPPGQSRDWIHVDDVVRGALAVVDSMAEEPVNLCTGVATEMGELMMKVYQTHLKGTSRWPEPTTADAAEWVEYLEDKPTGVYFRVGDPSRMLQFYQPKISLEDGIRLALNA